MTVTSERLVTPDQVRAAVRAWVSENWDASLSLLEWRTRLVRSGWAVPSWPNQWYGRDLPEWANSVAREEILSCGSVGAPIGTGMSLVAPAIRVHGPDATRERFLYETLTGVLRWCQLFSEPGAGSDLAALTTRAEFDGEEWFVSGQKVWNTSANHAGFGLLLARTDWDVPKHRGLTMFALPMRQPGVEVRPLRQMNDRSSFNEVFMTDARLPRDNVIGELNDGWRVAMTTLAFERDFGSALTPPDYSAHAGLALREAAREAAEHFQTYDWYPQREGRVDLVLERARLTGRLDDPVIRQEIAKLLMAHRTSKLTADRARAASAAGQEPGPGGSIGKLSMSRVAQQAARVHTLLLDADGMLAGADAPLAGVLAEILLSVPAQSIAGGTDEIQLNILGEKILGLPREPAVDRDMPFRDIPR
jgi:alkylation response protein AidB-like acyl-CoA dehydrogenase